mgnify:CR=1|jgi:hypothetical protein
MIDDALVAYLKTLTAVTAIVGTGDDARIRPDRLEDSDTRPCIVIEVEDEDPANDLTGTGGLVFTDVSIYSIARTKAAARALAEAIRLNGTDPGTGLAGCHATAASIQFDAVLYSTQIDYIPLGDGSSRGNWHVNSLYTVSYQETI